MHTAFSLTPYCVHIFSIHPACCPPTWTLCWREKKVTGYQLILCNFVRTTPSDWRCVYSLCLREAHIPTAFLCLSFATVLLPAETSFDIYCKLMQQGRKKSYSCVWLKCSQHLFQHTHKQPKKKKKLRVGKTINISFRVKVFCTLKLNHCNPQEWHTMENCSKTFKNLLYLLSPKDHM